MISIGDVVAFEFCVIFTCCIFSISIEVKLSLKHWGLEYFYAYYGIAWGAKKALDETYYNASERGESEGASLWGDLDQDQ